MTKTTPAEVRTKAQKEYFNDSCLADAIVGGMVAAQAAKFYGFRSCAQKAGWYTWQHCARPGRPMLNRLGWLPGWLAWLAWGWAL